MELDSVAQARWSSCSDPIAFLTSAQQAVAEEPLQVARDLICLSVRHGKGLPEPRMASADSHCATVVKA